jgi:hypothetical protein
MYITAVTAFTDAIVKAMKTAYDIYEKISMLGPAAAKVRRAAVAKG